MRNHVRNRVMVGKQRPCGANAEQLLQRPAGDWWSTRRQSGIHLRPLLFGRTWWRQRPTRLP